jgi:pantetheine-phosphate adenylyltransferase
MKVCIGGTFDNLHKGHKKLIDKAIETAGKQGEIFIGVTTGEIIKSKKNVKPFEKRKETIENYLSHKKITNIYKIKPIEDIYGPTLDEDFDAIIVSPETQLNAEKINIKRKQKRKKPLKIVIIPFVLSDDGIPISSSRIKNKEINEN